MDKSHSSSGENAEKRFNLLRKTLTIAKGIVGLLAATGFITSGSPAKAAPPPQSKNQAPSIESYKAKPFVMKMSPSVANSLHAWHYSHSSHESHYSHSSHHSHYSSRG